jgi:antitoxin ParD1/3/4
MTDEIESWLHTEVAPAFDRLKADPSRALNLDEIRAMLAAEHAQAVAKKHRETVTNCP